MIEGEDLVHNSADLRGTVFAWIRRSSVVATTYGLAREEDHEALQRDHQSRLHRAFEALQPA